MRNFKCLPSLLSICTACSRMNFKSHTLPHPQNNQPYTAIPMVLLLQEND